MPCVGDHIILFALPQDVTPTLQIISAEKRRVCENCRSSPSHILRRRARRLFQRHFNTQPVTPAPVSTAPVGVALAQPVPPSIPTPTAGPSNLNSLVRLDDDAYLDLKWFRNMYQTHPDKLWCLDTESTMIHQYVILREFAIYDVKVNPKLSAHIEYGDPASVLHTLRALGSTDHRNFAWLFTDRPKVKISALRRQILDLGFSSDSHHILAYGGPDSSLFARVMAGGDEVLVNPTVEAHNPITRWGRRLRNPFNPLLLAQKMFPEYTAGGAGGYTLRHLHDMVCGISDPQSDYHTAKGDAWALAELLGVMASKQVRNDFSQ